jgi:uncharacterized protein YqkB
MTDLLTDTTHPPIKAFKVGKQGHGKTGADACLVAMGLKLRILDYDNGSDILKNLLTKPFYPYHKYMLDHKIPLSNAINVQKISERMIKKTEKIGVDELTRYVPEKARGFSKTVDLLEDWKDKEVNFGPIETWESDVILSIDTLGTLADLAYFHTQNLNGRLGARQEGFDYQRDVGGAQGILRNLIQKLFSPLVKCNVLINAHITYVDESKGFSSVPTLESISDPTGYPQAIGRALSPVIGKWFNNVFILEQAGSDFNPTYEIRTMPSKNVAAKTSLPGLLKSRYPIETGMAEIFCALRGEKPPQELIDACSKMKPKVAAIPGTKTTPIPVAAK